MAGIDEVLERLVTDPEFRARLSTDPTGALSGYMLYDEDLEILAAALDDDPGTAGAVEQRTSKTTLAGLFAAFEGVQADAAPEVDDEVVVGYELGDSNVNRPYVLGTVYNEPLAEEGDSAEPMAKMERNEVGVESLELQHEGFEQDSGYFDGRLLSATDLAGDATADDPQTQD